MGRVLGGLPELTAIVMAASAWTESTRSASKLSATPHSESGGAYVGVGPSFC